MLHKVFERRQGAKCLAAYVSYQPDNIPLTIQGFGRQKRIFIMYMGQSVMYMHPKCAMYEECKNAGGALAHMKTI